MFYTESTEQASKISFELGIAFIVISIFLIAVGVITIMLFIRYSKRKAYEKKQNFKIEKGKNEIMSFWSSYSFIFISVASFIGALILFGLGLAGLIQ